MAKVTPMRTPAPPARADDMAALRKRVSTFCAQHDFADYESVNVILTLRRTANEFTNLIESYCGEVSLTPGRLNVLMVLYTSTEKAMPLSEIGNYLVVTRPNITGLIDGLVRDGLVRRIDRPDDRRMVLAQLTDKGRKFMAWFAPFHHKVIKGILGCLSSTEKRQLVTLLDKVRARARAAEVPRMER